MRSWGPLRGGSPFQQKGSTWWGCRGLVTLTFTQILASTSRTDAANHLLPLAVGMPRSLRALAMARSDVAPLACTSAITSARSAARAAAASALASAPFWRSFAVSLAGAESHPASCHGVWRRRAQP